MEEGHGEGGCRVHSRLRVSIFQHISVVVRPPASTRDSRIRHTRIMIHTIHYCFHVTCCFSKLPLGISNIPIVTPCYGISGCSNMTSYPTPKTPYPIVHDTPLNNTPHTKNTPPSAASSTLEGIMTRPSQVQPQTDPTPHPCPSHHERPPPSAPASAG